MIKTYIILSQAVTICTCILYFKNKICKFPQLNSTDILLCFICWQRKRLRLGNLFYTIEYLAKSLHFKTLSLLCQRYNPAGRHQDRTEFTIWKVYIQLIQDISQHLHWRYKHKKQSKRQPQAMHQFNNTSRQNIANQSYITACLCKHFLSHQSPKCRCSLTEVSQKLTN